MSSGFATRGTYISPVLDATQISRFGKMQLHGSLPSGTSVSVSTRSGNVKEPREKGWSPWSEDVPAEQFLPIKSPSARFLQYRVSFATKDSTQTPLLDDVHNGLGLLLLAAGTSASRGLSSRKADADGEAYPAIPRA